MGSSQSETGTILHSMSNLKITHQCYSREYPMKRGSELLPFTIRYISDIPTRMTATEPIHKEANKKITKRDIARLLFS